MNVGEVYSRVHDTRTFTVKLVGTGSSVDSNFYPYGGASFPHTNTTVGTVFSYTGPNGPGSVIVDAGGTITDPASGWVAKGIIFDSLTNAGSGSGAPPVGTLQLVKTSGYWDANGQLIVSPSNPNGQGDFYYNGLPYPGYSLQLEFKLLSSNNWPAPWSQSAFSGWTVEQSFADHEALYASYPQLFYNFNHWPTPGGTGTMTGAAFDRLFGPSGTHVFSVTAKLKSPNGSVVATGGFIASVTI